VPLFAKTAYRDEPSFKNIKVVTSLYAKSLKKDIGKNFKQQLEFKNVKSSMLKAYKDKFDWTELGKLAIDYSDALVLAEPDVNAKLLDYAKETGLPMIDYVADDPNMGTRFEEFYDSMF